MTRDCEPHGLVPFGLAPSSPALSPAEPVEKGARVSFVNPVGSSIGSLGFMLHGEGTHQPGT
jgi:hypothetical protein